MKRSAWFSAVVLSAGFCTPGAFGQIKGTATYDGKAPERQPIAAIAQDPVCSKMHKDPVLDESVVADKKGNLANVVVFLKAEGLKGPVPKDEVVLDQKGCLYVPHVLDITVGQKLTAMNSDPMLHNVHSLPANNPPINKAQVVKGAKDEVPVKSEERFKVKCDVHPWMSAWVYAFDHPYHSTTIDDGTYEIATEGLKDGEYTIAAWQEKMGESEPQKVTVKGGKADKAIDFKFKPKAAAAPAAGEKVVTLTSLTGAAADACCDEACDAAKTPVAAVKK